MSLKADIQGVGTDMRWNGAPHHDSTTARLDCWFSITAVIASKYMYLDNIYETTLVKNVHLNVHKNVHLNVHKNVHKNVHIYETTLVKNVHLSEIGSQTFFIARKQFLRHFNPRIFFFRLEDLLFVTEEDPRIKMSLKIVSAL